MLWYYKNKQPYLYPSQKILDNPLTQRFRNSVYEDSNEMELYYALQYMKENNITDLDVIFPIEELSVNYGRENDINKDFCNQENIHYRYENRAGGCMVLFPNNMITCSIYPSDNFLRQQKFLQNFTEWLQSKDIKALTNGNDIMINNKKVVGAVSETLPEPYKGWIYFGTQISINANADLISKICTKPSIKIPGALSDYNITIDEAMEWILNWFNSHK